MSNSTWSQQILQLLRRMNNFYLPGSRRSECLRFEVNGAQVGWVPPHVASVLTRYPKVFCPPRRGALSLCPSWDSNETRSAAVDSVLRTERQEGSLTCLKGWRDEKYSVMPKFFDPPLMWMERAATSLFGVKRYGVHVNGYTIGNSGEVSMWLARRSLTKQTYPGLLDNVAAGGIAAGVSIKNTLVKECQEEACIPATLAEKACPVANVSSGNAQLSTEMKSSQRRVTPTWTRRGCSQKVSLSSIWNFLWTSSLEQVKELLATDDFKPNCAMVVLDFLIRHSFIDPDTEPCYQEFVAGLHQTL
uniref:DUF4743 domain-containing protein n=1 Tax=Gasterosteus aculeatus aculeatus TaxID=481459 RepID=A0AAQ4NZR2_GASAC|nr:thiamin pyrophosphokinase 2 isoform X1 [Gasterosteus aculeatus aculeatus]